MNEVDWNEAPDGAMRYNHLKPIYPWLLKLNSVVFYHDGKDWMKYNKNERGQNDWINGAIRPTSNDIDTTITQRGELNDGDKYERTLIALCGTHVKTDVYRVLDAFKTDDPTLDHLIKKALCAGLRGHKDKLTDYRNIVESAQKALTLLEQKNNGK